MVAYTTTYNLKKPTVADDEDVWGGYLNDSMDIIDDVLDGTVPVTGIDINSGTLDNVVIGGATANTGTFTVLSATTSLGVTGNITVSGTVDGVDIATRDGVLTTTTTTANAALPKAGGTMTGAITFAAGQTFDGRDVSADGSKLDGIESGATADQTAAEIRALVESATDSNVFTDDDHTKLNGIETGATADQTASEILTAIKTVDGSGSGLDADTVDSLHASSFLRSDAADSTSSTISFIGDIQVGDQIYHYGDTNTYMQFHAGDHWRVVTGGGERLEVNNTRTQIYTLLTNAAIGEDYDALSGTSPTADPDAGGAFSLTMTGNTTFTFGAPALGSGVSTGFIIELTGNGGTVTWPSSVDWAGGTAPDAPASGETDIYVFWTRDGGTTWYGVQSIDAAA